MFIVPKLCGVKLHSEMLGNIAMVMWNLLGLGAVVTLLNGFTQGREYAELIWPLAVLSVAVPLAAIEAVCTPVARSIALSTSATVPDCR